MSNDENAREEEQLTKDEKKRREEDPEQGEQDSSGACRKRAKVDSTGDGGKPKDDGDKPAEEGDNPTDETALTDAELNQKIANQLAYYFSDVNLVRDKFLQEEFKKDDGWVKLSVLLTFKRLQQLTTDEQRLIDVLKESKLEDVEIDETKKAIKRTRPIPEAEELRKQLQLKTLHISGFPTDYQFEHLQRFCASFGPVESCQMRRHYKTKFFKGCVHVVYKDEATVKKVLSEKPLKCKDRELRVETMEQYHKRHAEIAEKRKERKKENKRVKPES